MIEIVHGYNIEVLANRRVELQQRVTLAYLDPPFFSGRTFSGSVGEFEDSTAAGMLEYLERLRRICHECWGALSNEGSLVVHLDWHAVHHVKVMLDKLLGYDNFASEIIWRYCRWPTKTRNFQRVHDTLLRYVKDAKKCRWNQRYDELAPSTRKQWGTKRQRAVCENGQRKVSSSTDDESPGVPMGDVWDIPIIAPVAKERTGWPTQKPEALIERLVMSCTDPGDLVLSPYCGSGTVGAVCQRLGRDCLEIDENIDAVNVARGRLGVSE